MNLFSGCSETKETVVLYTSWDQMYSEPIIEKFEEQMNIDVLVVYDGEATKTVGLVNRLMAEKDNPQADVFWNSEIARTIVLKNNNVLEKYVPENWDKIDNVFKDVDGNYWTGFAARSRVLVYNTDLIDKESVPKTTYELLDETWKGKLAVANPLYGTTGTHFAALYSFLGKNESIDLFEKLYANSLIVESNSMVRNMVADGKCLIGLTDTDDAYSGIENGMALGIVYLDQAESSMGTFFIPNTVCLIKNSPNQENGKKLIDYLVSEEVESMLAESESHQIPLIGANGVMGTEYKKSLKVMDVSYEELGEIIEESQKNVQEIFQN